MTREYASDAINAVLFGRQGFCKFLSATDTNAANTNQAGMLLPVSAESLLFLPEEIAQTGNLERTVKIEWQSSFVSENNFKYYRNYARKGKKELRITKFGRGFPFLTPEYTGALLVLVRKSREEYSAFILNTEEEIEEFLNAFGLNPMEADCIINTEMIQSEVMENNAIKEFIAGLTVDFPESEIMSAAARNIENQAYNHAEYIFTNPDKKIIDWTNMEYALFRAVEYSRYGELIGNGFQTVEEFVRVANMVLNRRKSRAGKSLEHHLAAIFDGNRLCYERQVVTENGNKPDFLFPSQSAYRNQNYAPEKLIFLAAKTTCKDRWRQILHEADRLKDGTKYLFTLQRGISGKQMDAMQKEKVVLVVPKPYISEYPEDRQDRIWTLTQFIAYVKEVEGI
ncbi:type II restriction endonuclease [Lachnospiraceae bacterium 38-10]